MEFNGNNNFLDDDKIILDNFENKYFNNFLDEFYNNKENNFSSIIELNNNSHKIQKKNSSHHKINLKIFICFFGKTYKSKENIILHIKNIHLDEKPYSCEFCHTGFSHRNGKNYHMRKFHTKFLPYICKFNQCKIIL